MIDPTYELEQIHGSNVSCGFCGDTGYVHDPKKGWYWCSCYDFSMDNKFCKWSEEDEFLILEVTCRRCGRKEVAKDETEADCWWQIEGLCQWDTDEFLCRDCAKDE